MRAPRWWMVIPILTVASLALAAMPARAASVQTNPLCWPSDGSCERAHGALLKQDLSCNAFGWFPCVPNRPIDIAVHIPGKDETKPVADIADYIARIYRYAVPVAAVLAVIAIMVGGILWLTSAGAERLSVAKKWIGNAVIGLLLALLSYTILQTINPDLVRLSLPQIRMIRQVALGGKFCTDIVRNAEANNSTAQFLESKDGQNALVFDKAASENITGPFRCDNTLYPIGTSSETCIGTVCGREKVCVPQGDKFVCVKGMLGGRIMYSGKAYADYVKLMAYCRDRSSREISSLDIDQGAGETGAQQFALSRPPVASSSTVCGGRPDDMIGLYLKIEVNDTSSKWLPTWDDTFVIFKSACGAGSNINAVDPDNLEATLGASTPGDPRLWRPEEFFSIAGRGQPPANHPPCDLTIDPSILQPR